MAESAATPVPSADLEQVIKMMWGDEVKDEVFQRWNQGFKFSSDEPTALIQREGGPCAVIAPVQAFILKSLISESPKAAVNWNEAGNELVSKLLIRALCEILRQAYAGNKYILVHMKDSDSKATSDESASLKKRSTGRSKSPSVGELSGESAQRDEDEDEEISTDGGKSQEDRSLTSENRPCDHSYFHSQLRAQCFESTEEIEAYYSERVDSLRETFGVLLFLYSVLCTKGVEALHYEVADPTEPFVDGEFGYGSQSLINLMLSGRAVAHVWNYDQDICGLKLKGIDKQCQVGFLTLLEHMRYCEVGSFLKNPVSPVWVLGSETHLTVLFSFEKRLVGAETPSERARRVFKSFDPEGNNFISAALLQDVLSALDLVSDPEYVNIMRRKLDSENLGIILLSIFMDEFFPEETVTVPDTFTLYHYNGLLRSSPNNKVVYQEGSAVLLESHVTSVLESNNMLTCLQTKWPSIEVQWRSGVTPSLN